MNIDPAKQAAAGNCTKLNNVLNMYFRIRYGPLISIISKYSRISKYFDYSKSRKALSFDTLLVRGSVVVRN